jgi:hypothetical protein
MRGGRTMARFTKLRPIIWQALAVAALGVGVYLLVHTWGTYYR